MVVALCPKWNVLLPGCILGVITITTLGRFESFFSESVARFNYKDKDKVTRYNVSGITIFQKCFLEVTYARMTLEFA